MAERSFNFRLDALSRLTCPQEKKLGVRFGDTRVPGLFIRVLPSGTKTYQFYRRLPDNNESPRKIVELKIGRFEEVKLEQARERAIELNYMIGQGKDPTLQVAPALTYGQLFERYIEEYGKPHTRTWEETVKNHDRHFQQWHARAVKAIKREHVQTWVNTLGKTSGKYAANRAFNTFRAVFNWGLSQGIIRGDNPCTGIKTFRTESRERFLQPGTEFQKFATALNDEPNETIRDFLWMCLFTGARCSNVVSMEWSHIDLQLAQWRIPITKNQQSQTIPLTQNAMRILRRRKKAAGQEERWVFPSDRKGWKTGALSHIVAPRHAFQRIVENAGIEDLRIHDLRRTAGSYMAMQNVSPVIIGKALGHRSPQSTAIYMRLTQDPVRAALEQAQQALSNPSKVRKPTRQQTKPKQTKARARRKRR